MYKKFEMLILSALLVVQGVAREHDVPIANPTSEEFFSQFQPQLETIQYRKICPYGSFSFSSGFGLSWRNRNNFKGRAIDLKTGVGYIPVPFGGDALFQSVSLDYNWCTFYKPSESSPYLSWGVGAAVLFGGEKVLPIPLVPLRAGYQFNYGFVDVGVKMFLWMPIPELRGGMSFKF